MAEERSEYRRGHCGEATPRRDDDGRQWSELCVVVSNTAGTVTSAAAGLTVNAAAVAPAITAQPVSQTVTAGQTASFTVVATDQRR